MQHALQATRALCQREIIKFLKDRSRLIGAFAQPLGFWLVLGLGFSSTFVMPGETGQSIGYLEFLYPGILVLVLLFTAIFSTIYIVEDRKSGFLQAGLVAPISRTVLVTGNVLGGTTLAVGQAVLFLFAAPLIGIVPSLPGLLIVLLSATLTAAAFTALGFMIAWRMESTRGFHAIMNLFLLPLWLLSGAFFPISGAQPLLEMLMRFNPVTYGVAAIRQGLYWPAEAPGVEWSLFASMAVMVAFTLLMIWLAVRVVRRPMYGS